jgi:hypothetical protein
MTCIGDLTLSADEIWLEFSFRSHDPAHRLSRQHLIQLNLQPLKITDEVVFPDSTDSIRRRNLFETGAVRSLDGSAGGGESGRPRIQLDNAL